MARNSPKERKNTFLVKKQDKLWGTVPSLGNVDQPPLRKASGERGWRAGPTSMDGFSSVTDTPNFTFFTKKFYGLLADNKII